MPNISDNNDADQEEFCGQPVRICPDDCGRMDLDTIERLRPETYERGLKALASAMGAILAEREGEGGNAA